MFQRMIWVPILVFLAITRVSGYNYQTQGADWPELSGFCGGIRQSPIDIIREEAVMYSGSEMLSFSTSYCTAIEGVLSNNGHTLIFNTEDGEPNSASFMTGGPLGDSNYLFLQFHLHWGCGDSWGSEHLVDGQRLPAELHLVHVKEDYVSESGIDPEAFVAGDGLAVLAIFLEGGKSESESSWFEFMAEAAREIAEAEEGGFSGSTTTTTSYYVTDVSVNLNHIVHRINPTFVGTKFNYWHYEGSLTTPECNEAVQFMVVERALPVTDDQLSALFNLTDSDGIKMVRNYRLEQDLNCRKVNYIYNNADTEYTFKPCADGTYPLDATTCVDCKCHPNGSNGNCDSTGVCECNSGYLGDKCNMCTSGYYDGGSGCQECGCNPNGDMGAGSCSSDGTCTCSSGYTGEKCYDCESGMFYQTGGDTCNACNCNGKGVRDSDSTCDSSGQCNCNEDLNFTGLSCRECLPGYYFDEFQQFCYDCVCNTDRTVGGSSECDYVNPNQQCDCISGASGATCDNCAAGHTGLLCDTCESTYYDSGNGCQPCNCFVDGTVNFVETCDTSGQCPCRDEWTGKTCGDCIPGYYYDSGEVVCYPCECDTAGTVGGSSDCEYVSQPIYDGVCDCASGFTGIKCDEVIGCASGMVCD